jgi:Tfp pilus assembly protein PilX
MLRLHRDERGQSLVIVLSLITIMFLLGSSLAVHGSVALRSTRASEGQGDEFYAADAATELGIWWQRNGKAGNPPAQTINGITTSTTITSVGGGGGSCTENPRPVWISGFESGVLLTNTTNTIGVNGTGTGFAGVQSGAAGIVDMVPSPARTGGFSMRIAPNSAAGNYAYLEAPGGVALGNWQVVHVAIRFGALPTKETNLITLSPGSGTMWPHGSGYLYYKPSTGKWAVGLGNSSITLSQESNVNVALDTWYTFDLRMQVLGTNTRMVEWYIDGVAQPTLSVVDAAASPVGPRIAFGQYVLTSPNYGSAYTAYFDDVVISTTSGDFPLGPLNVAPKLPNEMGTGGGAATSFQNNDNSAINATSWQRIDEQPMTALADYLKQVAGSSDYVQVRFQDTTETCIRGASMVTALHSAGTASNSGSVNAVMFLPGTWLYPITAGDFSETTLRYGQRVLSQNSLTPGVGPWSQGLVNGTEARFGFSDFNPVPYWDAILMEVAYHPLTGGPATVTIVGTGGGSTITTDYLDAGAGAPTLNTWTTTK